MHNVKLILFNPKSNSSIVKQRFPTAIGELTAAINGRFDYAIVDGNLLKNPLKKILHLIDAHDGCCVIGISVMPGYQVVQAIEISKKIKLLRPNIYIIWGGFFPSFYPKTILKSGYVNAVVIGQGDNVIVETLIELKKTGELVGGIEGLSVAGDTLNNFRGRSLQPMSTNPIPYHSFSMVDYLKPSGVGKKTLYYASGMGCTHSCSFCGIKRVYNGHVSWYGRAPEIFEQHIRTVVNGWGCDSLQFVDADQFPELEWAEKILNIVQRYKLNWRGYATIEFLAKQKNTFWDWLVNTRCRSLYFGVESAEADCLMTMTKKTSMCETFHVAAKCKEHGIIPEFSFVLLSPEETPESLNKSIEYIRNLKKVSPDSNVIIYFYSPPLLERQLTIVDETAVDLPSQLSNWTDKKWYNHMVWNNPGGGDQNYDKELIKRAINFRRVLYSRFPKVTDVSNNEFKIWLSKAVAFARYQSGFYLNPLELRTIDRIFNINKIE